MSSSRQNALTNRMWLAVIMHLMLFMAGIGQLSQHQKFPSSKFWVSNNRLATFSSSSRSSFATMIYYERLSGEKLCVIPVIETDREKRDYSVHLHFVYIKAIKTAVIFFTKRLQRQSKMREASWEHNDSHRKNRRSNFQRFTCLWMKISSH